MKNVKGYWASDGSVLFCAMREIEINTKQCSDIADICCKIKELKSFDYQLIIEILFL